MYDDNNILIFGFGVTGQAALKCMNHFNANIYVYDEDKEKLEKYGSDIFKIFKEEYLEKIDFIIKSPGINPDHPLLKKARENKVTIKSDLEIFYEICKSKNTVAITGTNGKTTTTSLVASILEEVGKTYCVGNIGSSVLDAALVASEDDYVVIESSSFQLDDTFKFRPKIAVVTNVTSDHLDWHKTVENYRNAKYKIFKNQNEDDYIVFNSKNQELSNKEIKSQKYKFSTDEVLENGSFIQDGKIYFSKDSIKEEIMPVDEIKIPGAHNLENILCAVNACKLLEIDKDIIRKVISNFMGVEHRIEFVKEINNVKYYNDSKGTNPDSTIMAIKAIDKNIVLIAGGYDKNANYEEFLKVGKDRIKHLILLGETAEKIQKEAKKLDYDIYIVSDMKKAVQLSSKIAEEGDTVLLSPACASWDMYPSYEIRGKDFKNLVNELI